MRRKGSMHPLERLVLVTAASAAAFAALPPATDSGGEIKGYASASSVNKGGRITFFVTVNPSQRYTIDVYRLGWYGGKGGRLLRHAGPLTGVRQPDCPIDSSTGLIACDWKASWTLQTKATW